MVSETGNQVVDYFNVLLTVRSRVHRRVVSGVACTQRTVKFLNNGQYKFVHSTQLYGDARQNPNTFNLHKVANVHVT